MYMNQRKADAHTPLFGLTSCLLWLFVQCTKHYTLKEIMNEQRGETLVQKPIYLIYDLFMSL